MGRSGLTTLTFFSLAVFLLQECGLTKGRANVTLLARNNELRCIAQGDAASSALAWTSDKSPPVAPKYGFTGDTGLECNFMAPEKCIGWEGLQDWKVFSSLQQPVPPLLDYRWDELSIISTDGKHTVLKKNNVILPQGQTSYFIRLSVTAASDASIFLCEGENPFKSGCYWFLIGGWATKTPKSVIRRCPVGVNSEGYPRGDCGTIFDEHKGQLLSTGKWLHVAVHLAYYSGYFRVTVFAGNKHILQYDDEDPLLVQFLNVRSGENVPAYFKIQNYNFIGASNNKILKSPLFTPQSSQLCLSVLYHFEQRNDNSSLEVYLEYADSSVRDYASNNPIKSIGPSQGFWREERITHSLTPGWENGIRIKFLGRSNSFSRFSIGSVRECNPQGDVRISSVELSFDKRASVTCHPLMYEDEKLTLTKPDSSFTGCGPDCPVSCTKLPTYSHGDCSGFTLCQPTGTNSSTCFCSLGYMGENCWTSCGYQTYGLMCREKCGECAAGSCNNVDGSCVYGCNSGFRPPLCKLKYPKLEEAPKCLSATQTTVIVSVENLKYTGEGDPTQIRLEYKINEKDHGDQYRPTWITAETFEFRSREQIEISDLQHDTTYFIRAVLLDHEGKGYTNDDIPYSTCNTTCDHPSAVDAIPGRRNITVNWQKPHYACTTLKLYSLIVKDDEGKQLIIDKTITTLPYEASPLEPFRSYKWVVSYLRTEILTGNITTLEDAPSQVRSLTSTQIDPNTLVVSWVIPEFPNGRIKNYAVTYQHYTYLGCEHPTANETSKGSLTTEDNSTTIELKNLVPYSQYLITVKGFTIEYGKEVKIYATTSEIALPQVRPEQSQQSEVLYTYTAVVYWEPPKDCTSIKGPIDSYEINIMGVSPWAKSFQKQFSKAKNERYIAFNNMLIPHTEYIVTVFVGRRNGLINQELPYTRNFTTSPAKPGHVINATAYSFGDSWVYLRWDPPYPPYGELKNYKIEYRQHNAYRFTSFKTKTFDKNSMCELWEGKICAKLEKGAELKKNTEYDFRISAQNNEPDEYGDYFTVTAKTQEKAPGPPINLNISNLSPTTMNLTWQHPYFPNGKMRGFEIRAILISSALRRREDQKNISRTLSVTKSAKNYSFEVTDLLPSTVYKVFIHGKTNEHGEDVFKDIMTPLSTPKFESELNIVQNSITETSFKVNIPPADPFLTTKGTLFLIITSSKEEVPEHEAGSLFKSEGFKEEDLLAEAGVKEDRHSWVAAKIMPEDRVIEFTVGDNSTLNNSDSYWNRILTKGTYYQVTLVAVNQLKDDYKFGAVKLKEQVQTPHGGEEGGSDPGAGDNNGDAWAALLLLLIIPVAVYFILKRRRRMKKQDDTLELETDDIFGGNKDVSTDNIITPDLEPDEMPSGPKLSPSQRFSRKVAITDLENYVKTGLTSGELQRQHALFPRGQTRPWDYGRHPKNKTKNRYGNLIAYDDTRVKLKKLPEDPFSDYINANYINGYKSPKFYIATQGPKQNTVVDFWRMIWQEHVQVITMLTNIVENGKLKCEQYWPEVGKELIYGDVTIMNASYKIFADYTFRLLNVTCKGKTRKIHHLHFTSWPDHGVPLYPQSVASFLKKVLATPPGTGPIVVHCSAGVGRTGTIILADTCLRMAAAEGCVDILGFLQQIREQRANMVDNLDQYKLVHLILLECLVTEPSSIPCDGNIEKHVENLRQDGSLKRQFTRLHELRWQDQALKPSSKPPITLPGEVNNSKNRSKDIVPGTGGKIFISRYPLGDIDSDYINAIYVDGFRTKDQFIATQFPLPSTVGDFWRLISEKNVSLIVVLNEVDEHVTDVCKFWPSEEQMSLNPMPHLTVKWKTSSDSNCWTTHNFQLSDSSSAVPNKDYPIRILQLNGWKCGSKLPPSASTMLELWQESERLYSGKGPIVVTCLDGATACGCFLALTFLIEKIKLEQECDVCQAVRTVRQNREQFVPTFEQFGFLYEAAITYLDSFQTYANFN